MVAIALAGTAEAVEWNHRGRELARGSRDPNVLALIPAMLDNTAWDLHGLGRFEEALAAQLELEAAARASGVVDGYVFEEVAKNREALGRREESRGWFEHADHALGRENSGKN